MERRAVPSLTVREPKLRRFLHLVFDVGIALKAINGGAEVIGGLALLVIPRWEVIDWINRLTALELRDDRPDWIARHLQHLAAGLSIGEKLFVGLYLLSHGLMKVLLVWALVRRKIWAYPIAIAVFTGFAVYQSYEWTLRHAPSLAVLTVIDVVVIALTAHEWWVRRSTWRS